MDDPSPLTDPAAILLGLAALAGLVASWGWLKVFYSIDTSGEVVKGPGKRETQTAALLSAISIGLASVGYLAGVFLPAL